MTFPRFHDIIGVSMKGRYKQLAKRKYIMVVDVETANGLDDPLVYDVGFIIGDYYGNIVESHSFAIKEIFSQRPELMQGAYYADKLTTYYPEIKDGRRRLASFYEMRTTMLDAMKRWGVTDVYAYNALFDKRALNTTHRYLTKSKYRHFFPYHTNIKCIWSMACDTIFQQKTFRKIALRECWFTNSAVYYSTNAETAHRYITKKYDFEEEHKGIDDVMIEYGILCHIRKQKKKMNQSPSRLCFKKCKI